MLVQCTSPHHWQTVSDPQKWVWTRVGSTSSSMFLSGWLHSSRSAVTSHHQVGWMWVYQCIVCSLCDCNNQQPSFCQISCISGMSSSMSAKLNLAFPKKVTVTFLYSAVSSPWDCSKYFTLHPMPPRLLWKVFSHAAITAQRLLYHISTTVYSQELIYTAE